MSATRTQVYFTAEQRRLLDSLAVREGTTLAAVVRAAVDAYLTDVPRDVARVLDESFGGFPDLELPTREDWDRGYS